MRTLTFLAATIAAFAFVAMPATEASTHAKTCGAAVVRVKPRS